MKSEEKERVQKETKTKLCITTRQVPSSWPVESQGISLPNGKGIFAQAAARPVFSREGGTSRGSGVSV
jgi:hypothetical protein